MRALILFGSGAGELSLEHAHALPTTTMRNAMLTYARQYDCMRANAELSAERAS